MGQWIQIVDRSVYGKTAAACALAGAGLLFFVIFQPLPWRHLPNVFKILLGSWLYLIIAGAIVSSALSSIVKRRGFPSEMFICVAVGVIWKYTAALHFIPFNFSRFLMIYGLAGIVGYCIRRMRSTAAVPAPVACT
jgi:hypothetical protein